MDSFDQTWSTGKRYGFLIAALLLIGTIYLLRDLIGPLLIAGLLAYVLNPAVHFLERRIKLNHYFAVITVYLFSLVLLIAAVILLTPLVARQLVLVQEELLRLEEQILATLGSEISIFVITIPIEELFANLQVNTVSLFEADRVFRVLRAGTTNVAWILVIAVTTYFLLLDWAKLRDWLIGLAPPNHQSEIQLLYRQLAQVWQAYLQGQLLLMAIIALITTVLSFAVGLPGALAMGLLTGFLDALPSVGPVIAIFIAGLIAWFEGSTFLPLSNELFTLLVLAIYQGIQIVENLYFRPRVMKVALKLHPAVVIIGIVASLTLAGILVTLIIIPLIGSAIVVGRYVHARMMPETSPG